MGTTGASSDLACPSAAGRQGDLPSVALAAVIVEPSWPGSLPAAAPSTGTSSVTAPACSNASVSGTVVPASSFPGQALSMTCGPPGSSTVGAPGATSIASTRRIFADAAFHDVRVQLDLRRDRGRAAGQPVGRGALGLEGHVSGAVRRVAQRGAHPQFLNRDVADLGHLSPPKPRRRARYRPPRRHNPPHCSSPVGPRRLRLALKRPAMPAVPISRHPVAAPAGWRRKPVRRTRGPGA